MVLLQLLVALIHEPSQQTFQSFTLIFNFALAKVPLTEVKVVRIWIKPLIRLLVCCLPWTYYVKGICFIVFRHAMREITFFETWQCKLWPARFKTHANSYGCSMLRLHIHV